jgi:predicted sulfurtransferase
VVVQKDKYECIDAMMEMHRLTPTTTLLPINTDLGGTHLSPSEFHQTILQNDNVLLIDARNRFEYDVGHFVNPQTLDKATNPETAVFSSFDATFCARRGGDLRDKKVLMYCTGGSEKASVMLKKGFQGCVTTQRRDPWLS